MSGGSRSSMTVATPQLASSLGVLASWPVPVLTSESSPPPSGRGGRGIPPPVPVSSPLPSPPVPVAVIVAPARSRKLQPIEAEASNIATKTDPDELRRACIVSPLPLPDSNMDLQLSGKEKYAAYTSPDVRQRAGEASRGRYRR